MYIKIVTGFRKDQAYSVPLAEAHKAYYLFLNPDARTIFSTGLALKGSDIQRIEPDYQGSMGWNPQHILAPDDMNEIHDSGIESKLKIGMNNAQEIARIGDPKDLQLQLSEAVEKYPHFKLPSAPSEGMKRIGEV